MGFTVSWRARGLLLPLTAFMLVFFLAPFLTFFVYSFWQVNGWDIVRDLTLQNYVDAFTDPIYPTLVLRSLTIGVSAGLLCILIAYPLSYGLAFKVKKRRDLLLFLILMTLFSNYLVRVYAWRSVLSTNGLLDVILVGLGLTKEPQSHLLYTPAGTLIALTNVYVPIAVLPIYSVLLNIPRHLIDAARDLGAGPLRSFFEIILPLSTPGVAVAFAFIFLLSAADFVTPLMVGGSDGTMIGVSITAQFSEAFNWPLGSALAITMIFIMALTLVLFALVGRILRIVRVSND